MNQGCREQQKETWFSPNSGLLLWLGELFTTGAGGSHPVVPPIVLVVAKATSQGTEATRFFPILASGGPSLLLAGLLYLSWLLSHSYPRKSRL